MPDDLVLARLLARIDSADIVQDALPRAALRLPVYLKDRPVTFLPWLKSIVNDELFRVHRQQVHAQRQSVNGEQSIDKQSAKYLPEDSDSSFVDRDHSPSQHAIVQEQRVRVRQILNWLNVSQREVLILRYVQQVTNRDIALALDIGEDAARSRLWRAQTVATRLLQKSLA